MRKSIGTVLATLAVLNILLLPSYGAAYFQLGNDITSSIPKDSYGRCELTDETPPLVRCGLNPSDDTFVDTFFPDTPFAKALGNPLLPNPILIVQDTTGLQHDVRYGNVSLNYAYVKFNLASVLPQELLTSHAQPRNATLWLYVRWVSPLYNATIRVYRALSNDWDENTLTWNTRPGLDENGYTETSVRADGTWVRWDVTDQVRAALEEGSMVSFGVIATEPSWRNAVWFDSNDQKLEGNVSTRPELDLDFSAPLLTIQTSYSNLPITIDDRAFETDVRGEFRAFLAWGQYEIAVPEVIPKGEGARAVFVGWSDNVSEPRRTVSIGNNMTLQSNYVTQYYLNVTSPYGTVNGSGWYVENKEALATVNPMTVTAEGLLGVLGIRRVFDHWSQDCTGTACRVIMDGPKRATAVWKDDYTFTVLAVVVLIVAAATLLLLRRKARRRRYLEIGHN